MDNDSFKTFGVEYPFEGGVWLFDIKAKNLAEAEARLKAIGWGKIVGELGMTLPGWVPAWCVSLYCRWLKWRGV